MSSVLHEKSDVSHELLPILALTGIRPLWVMWSSFSVILIGTFTYTHPPF